MERIKKLLEARESYLLRLKNEKEKALENTPAGALRICSHKGRTQYYKRSGPKDSNGTYLREEDHHIAKKLAQKDYDQRVLCAIDKELNAINKYFSNYPTTNIEEIQGKLHRERQKLIEPVIKPEEEFVHDWESFAYQGKGFYEDNPEFYTAKGERVRSKSELIIADLLNKEGIPYRYECPIHLKGFGKVYPDFTTLNIRKRKTLYWEHLGMMDDPSYVDNALQKIATFIQNGIFPGENLILTYETKKNPINQKQLMLMIQHYLL